MRLTQILKISALAYSLYKVAMYRTFENMLHFIYTGASSALNAIMTTMMASEDTFDRGDVIGASNGCCFARVCRGGS